MSKKHLMLVLLAAFAATPALVTFAEDKHDHKHDDKKEHKDKDDDGTKEVEIKFSELPAKVAEGFKKDFPGAEVEEVKKETYKDGTIHYEIEFKDKDGKEHEVEYNTDGEKLEDHK